MIGALEVLAVVLLAGNVAVALERRWARIHAVWALEEAESDWPAQLQDPRSWALQAITEAHRPKITVSREMLTTVPGDMVAAMTYEAHRAEASAAWSATWTPPLDDPDGGRRGD